MKKPSKSLLIIIVLCVILAVVTFVSSLLTSRHASSVPNTAQIVTVTPSASTPSPASTSGRNDVIAPPAAPPVHQPKLAAQDYVVRPGDTLWSISGHFANIPGWYPAIANASWVKNPDLIYPGQVLHIPEIP